MTATRLDTLERLRHELDLRSDAISDSADQPGFANAGAADGATNHELPPPTRSMLLTIPEACTELRISRAQFYILADKQRAIETVHIGKLRRVPRQALEQYVDGLRSGVSL